MTNRELIWWEALQKVRAVEDLRRRAKEGDQQAAIELLEVEGERKQ